MHVSNLTQTPARITYLRVSVTEACNFFCTYCRAGLLKPPPPKVGAREIRLLTEALIPYGLKTVRFTGGEPLLRKDLAAMIAAAEAPEKALTTNGYLLKERAKELKDAGLDRINVSLDALDPKKFKKLTGADLKPVLEGIDAALKAGFKKVKINAVLIKNFSEEEVLPLLYFAAERGLHLRFIELMPLGKNDGSRFLPASEVKRLIIERLGELKPLKSEGSGASRDYLLTPLGVKVGFITPVSDHFCEGCSKLRLTADGKIHLCLREDARIDLLPHLRSEESIKNFVPRLLEEKLKTNELLKVKNYSWNNRLPMVGLGG